MPEAVFSLSRVAKVYEGRQVLGIEELFIAPRMITAVNGHNGSGKSTLLKMLALLLRPDRGEVLYRGSGAGSELSALKWRREVTMVAQQAYLFNTTVAANVSYGLKLRRVSAAQKAEAVKQSLKAVGLAGFENRRASKLSGGEAQRVALARALAIKPRVLLLDEPFSNLDPESSLVFENVITALPEKGHTVILVSHYADQVERLAHRVLTLSSGEVQSDKPGGAVQ